MKWIMKSDFRLMCVGAILTGLVWFLLMVILSIIGSLLGWW